MTNFATIAESYENNAIIQKSAADTLLDLLAIEPDDDILDLGCGSGHLTSLLRTLSRGAIVGVDSSPGMITQARRKYGKAGIVFRHCGAERLDYREKFDKIFCNSAFQWFHDQPRVLRRCFRALKQAGQIGIQAPAKKIYSPNFIQAIERVRTGEETKSLFARFTSPWMFLETAEEYSRLCEQAGLRVKTSWIDKVVSCHSPQEVYRIFESGAAAGYLNPEYYGTSLPETYIAAFKETVRQCFAEQADRSGTVRLIFHRVYLLAQRP